MADRVASRLLMPGIVAVLAACGGAAGDISSVEEGRLRAERSSPSRQALLDAPARAVYCSGDSLLVVSALDGRWGAGLALRTAFPRAEAGDFTVLGSAGGDGTATAAFREVADSVRPALVATRGSARLEAGALATGTFDVTALLPGDGRDSVRLRGAFRAVPTTDTAAACGTAPRAE